jgi:hypothetical protein
MSAAAPNTVDIIGASRTGRSLDVATITAAATAAADDEDADVMA